MTEALQLGALLTAAIFTLWAGLVSLAAQGEAELPRVLATEVGGDWASLAAPRVLHVVHLALLVLAAALASFAGTWWAWPGAGAWIRLLLVVSLLWLVGDLLPRLLAVLSPESVPVARRLAQPTLAAFRPLMALVAFADRGKRSTETALAAAVDREMLHGVFALGAMTVAEVMTPRIDIASVDLTASTSEIMTAFQRARHSRLLVVDSDPDSVIGVLYAKDCLSALEPDTPADHWRSLIRPAQYVPEAKTLRHQLRDFQHGPSHLMVVVDEFGGTAGLVTLEDIVEQIVGEIQDEHDLEEGDPIQLLAPGQWAVQGGVALSELEASLQVEFDREDVNTVGGLVLALLGRVPRPGDAVELVGYRLQVEQVARRRIRRVLVRPIAEEVPPQEPAE
ncbi:MAG: hemolysin family protein [Gemmatimonadota bacterium]|nr:hemolysin family protein [Gemmatimonadota bacterium]